ncbi:glycosyltransferase family 4 protein [Patescibacteria group bacterium]|nr:glycosyltransferase family 4 protein [Patescibacteria group bacterium]
MKICFLTNTLNIDSGWGRYSYNIIDQINKNKEIKSIVLAEDAIGYSLVNPILKKSCKNLFFVFLNAFKARKYIKQCDIIHCLDAYPYGLIGTLANIGLNRKIIINVVGSYSIAPLEYKKEGKLLRRIYQKIKRDLLYWTYKKADYVLSISAFTEREILKRVKLKNTQIVHLGIDFNKFQIDYSVNKNNKKEKMILSVGALKRRKGYYISIPAIAQVKKKYPNIKYYIVADQSNQSYFKELKNLVAKHQLENNIIFLQKVSDKDLINLYYQSDLFLLTSVNIGLHFEGFGLVFLEANACGKPVIGTLGCGIEDAVKHEYNGLLVPQNNIDETAKAILRILDDPVLAQRLGDNGKQKAKNMSWQKTVEKYIEVYKLIYEK